MTDAEDALPAPALAAPETPAQDLVTEPDAAAVGHAAATVAPRRRRRWPAFLVAVAVILGLAAGVVVWAPWVVPPVLRPTGLVAGPSTVTAITLHWSRPPTGPLPDKYLIFNDDAKVATVAGTVTAYRQAGLDPATKYQYFVVAVRSDRRSAKSAPLSISTVTPPVSAARLQGSWSVYLKFPAGSPKGSNGYLTWQVTPACAVGACNVMLRSTTTDWTFGMKLTRAGEVYKGQAVANLGPCGSGANAIPDPVTVKIQIRVSAAVAQSQVWAASSFAGTFVGTSKYVSNAAGYCNPTTMKASVTGSPS